jgi:hypothetical protein
MWEWKLLYRAAGKTILEHTILAVTDVEVAHKIVVCLDYKDMAQVNGTAFNSAALDKTLIQSDERVKLHFSDKKDWVGKAYEACIKFGLTSLCIVRADAALTPPGLIKECIMRHAETLAPVHTVGYPAGIEVSVLPFHTIANLYRYRNYAEKQAELIKSIAWESINNTNEGPYYIYDGIQDLRFETKSSIAMLDALLTDVVSGADLSDLLKEWHEQK